MKIRRAELPAYVYPENWRQDTATARTASIPEEHSTAVREVGMKFGKYQDIDHYRLGV